MLQIYIHKQVFLKIDRVVSSSDKLSEIFNVLDNTKSHLDKVLEMNQISEVSVEDDSSTYDKIESHLIGCVSVICNAIKSRDDPRVKNVPTSVRMIHILAN